jgi:competence protein ComEC
MKLNLFKQFSSFYKRIRIISLVFLLLISVSFLMSGCNSTNGSSANANTVQSQSNKTSAKSEGTGFIGQLRIHYIDVGQGDSILIQQGNKNMLIDTGTNASQNALMAYLKKQNISKIDYLILTHPHEDHIGGAAAVINALDIGTLYMPKITTTTKTFKNLIAAMQRKQLKATIPVTGNTFNLGVATCTILGPLDAQNNNLNTYSIVIKLVYGKTKFLFTGDAQASNEKAMIDKGYDLSADVLKIGHHGSRTSTSVAFLNAVNPKYAVISVGKGNDYGHPHQQTLARLKAKGIKIYRTDESGTILCTSDGTNISFK